jgi:hypothetical protein
MISIDIFEKVKQIIVAAPEEMTSYYAVLKASRQYHSCQAYDRSRELLGCT